ncbi:hypothetical protein, partial [Streptomyces syringium]|uniref:hypothetical protein n=1 Tax=Streptomyces syringium TaxID=76729 RepID=UPI0034307DEA
MTDDRNGSAAFPLRGAVSAARGVVPVRCRASGGLVAGLLRFTPRPAKPARAARGRRRVAPGDAEAATQALEAAKA